MRKARMSVKMPTRLAIGFSNDFCGDLSCPADNVGTLDAKLIISESCLSLSCAEVTPQKNMTFTRAEFLFELTNKALGSKVALINGHV